MSLELLESRDVERLSKLLTAFENGQLTRVEQPEEELRRPPIETYLALTTETIPASDGFPVWSEVAVWGLDPEDDDITTEAQFYTQAYSLWNVPIGDCKWIFLNRDPYSGNFGIVSIPGGSPCAGASGSGSGPSCCNNLTLCVSYPGVVQGAGVCPDCTNMQSQVIMTRQTTVYPEICNWWLGSTSVCNPNHLHSVFYIIGRFAFLQVMSNNPPTPNIGSFGLEAEYVADIGSWNCLHNLVMTRETPAGNGVGGAGACSNWPDTITVSTTCVQGSCCFGTDPLCLTFTPIDSGNDCGCIESGVILTTTDGYFWSGDWFNPCTDPDYGNKYWIRVSCAGEVLICHYPIETGSCFTIGVDPVSESPCVMARVQSNYLCWVNGSQYEITVEKAGSGSCAGSCCCPTGDLCLTDVTSALGQWTIPAWIGGCQWRYCCGSIGTCDPAAFQTYGWKIWCTGGKYVLQKFSALGPQANYLATSVECSPFAVTFDNVDLSTCGGTANETLTLTEPGCNGSGSGSGEPPTGCGGCVLPDCLRLVWTLSLGGDGCECATPAAASLNWNGTNWTGNLTLCGTEFPITLDCVSETYVLTVGGNSYNMGVLDCNSPTYHLQTTNINGEPYCPEPYEGWEFSADIYACDDCGCVCEPLPPSLTLTIGSTACPCLDGKTVSLAFAGGCAFTGFFGFTDCPWDGYYYVRLVCAGAWYLVFSSLPGGSGTEYAMQTLSCSPLHLTADQTNLFFGLALCSDITLNVTE